MQSNVIRLAARHLRVSRSAIVSAAVVRVNGETQVVFETNGGDPFAPNAFDGRRVRLRTQNGVEGHHVDGRIHYLGHVDGEIGTYRYRFVPDDPQHLPFFIFQTNGTTSNISRIFILTTPKPCLFSNAAFTERASFGM